MTIRDQLAVLGLATLVALLALTVHLSDGAFISRHSAARDLPWSATARHRLGSEQPLNHTLSDSFNLIFPDVSYALSQRRASHLPLWNPRILGGVPHLANPMTAVSYPPNLLLSLVADPLLAILLSSALHIFLGAFFVYILLRRLGCRSFAALFGGIAFAFSGWNAAHLHNIQIVAVLSWLPLGLFAIETSIKRKRSGPLSLLALALGMMWTAGFPQLALLGSLALGVYAGVSLLWLLPVDGARFTARRSAAFLVFALLGGGLAAVQIVPTLELMEHAGHQERSPAQLEDHRFRTAGFLGLAMPSTLGNPMRAERWEYHLGARILLGEERPEAQGQVVAPVNMNWSERTLYPGLLVLLLALLSFAGPLKRSRLSLYAMALLSVLLASSPAVIAGAARLPGLAIGDPTRAIAILALCLPLLGALGLETLLARPRPQRFSRIGGVALGLIFLALCATVLWGHIEERAAFEALVEKLQSFGLEKRFKIPAPLPASAYVNDETLGAFRDFRSDLCRLAALCAAGIALLWLRSRKALPDAIGRGALLLFLLADLLTVFIPPNLPVAREGLFELTPGLAFLQKHLGDARFLRVSADAASARAQSHELLVPNLGLLFDLNDAQGWREQVPLSSLKLWEGVSAQVADVGFAGIAAAEADSPILDLARVRYLIASSPIKALESRRAFPLQGDGPLVIYDNPGCMERGWVVHRAIVLPDDEARAQLRDGRIDPRTTAVFSSRPEGLRSSKLEPASTPARVEIVEDSPERLGIDVRSEKAGFLIVADSWFPGWIARRSLPGQDPTPIPVLRAMTNLRALPVVAGEQHIELSYEPHSLLLGAGVSGLSLLSLLLWPLLAARRRKRRGQEIQGGEHVPQL